MKTDTKISGSGKIGQGEYNLIKISGSGAIEGPVTFETFKVSGSCKVVRMRHWKEMRCISADPFILKVKLR